MANEFTFSGTFQFLKSLARISAEATVSGTQCNDGTQSVGTSYEALDFGDMGTTPGYVMLQNLDPTNYVEISSDGGATYCIRLKAGSSSVAGGIAVFFNNSLTTWGARANTAACLVSVRAVAP
jgi:spore coat protein U-like protein